MSTLTIQMPEGLLGKLEEYALQQGMTLDQFIASAAAEKLSALLTVQHLRERAKKANRADFTAFLDASPDVSPMLGDER